MIASLILFGLQLDPLFNAIAQVETRNGAASANVYQIRNCFVDDVNRMYGLEGEMAYHYRDVLNREKSEYMMFLYWRWYAKRYIDKTNRAVTYEVLARIHNGGPRGIHKESTTVYWNKVKKELERSANAKAKTKVR